VRRKPVIDLIKVGRAPPYEAEQERSVTVMVVGQGEITAPMQSTGTDASKEMALSKGVENINVKAAPDTKTVARKHIERYRPIQKEADSPEVVTASDLDEKA
jgi:hypothetical protein